MTTPEEELLLKKLKEVDEKIDKTTKEMLEFLFQWHPVLTEDVSYREYLLNKYLKN